MLLELRVELFDFYHSQDSLGMTTFDTVAKKKRMKLPSWDTAMQPCFQPMEMQTFINRLIALPDCCGLTPASSCLLCHGEENGKSKSEKT